jgi:hypothetical protein
MSKSLAEFLATEPVIPQSAQDYFHRLTHIVTTVAPEFDRPLTPEIAYDLKYVVKDMLRDVMHLDLIIDSILVAESLPKETEQ